MRRIAASILCLVLALGVAVASEKPDAETLAWCKERGVVCLSPGEYEEVALRLVQYERDLSVARARRLSRIGWTLGPSMTVSADGQVVGGVGVTFGWRW